MGREGGRREASSDSNIFPPDLYKQSMYSGPTRRRLGLCDQARLSGREGKCENGKYKGMEIVREHKDVRITLKRRALTSTKLKSNSYICVSLGCAASDGIMASL